MTANEQPTHIGDPDIDRYLIREVIRHAYYDEKRYKITSKAIDRKRGIEVAYNQIFKNDSLVDTVTLIKEIEILQRLKNDHILTVYDYWQQPDSECYIFTTELLTYTLGEFLRRTQGVVKAVIIDWCEQILKGLNYLHSANENKGSIIHRDIRLDNLFYIHNGGYGQIKIGDLGLATLHKPEPKSARATSQYTAPEFYTNIYCEKVDIWSFGMNVIEMVTLKHPYTEYNTVSLCFAVTNGIKPRELYYIKDPSSLEFIACCLEMDSEKRWSARQLLDHPFITTIDEKSKLEFFQLHSDEEALQLSKENSALPNNNNINSRDTYRKNSLKFIKPQKLTNGSLSQPLPPEEFKSISKVTEDGDFDEIIEDVLEEAMKLNSPTTPIPIHSPNHNNNNHNNNHNNYNNHHHHPRPKIIHHENHQRSSNSPIKTRTDQQILMNILSFEQGATAKTARSASPNNTPGLVTSLTKSNNL